MPSYAQQSTNDIADLIARGMASRQQGQIRQAIDAFEQARARAELQSQSSPQTVESAQRATGELGVTLLQARRFAEAEASLLAAYSYFKGRDRARYAVYLGKAAQLQKRLERAETYYHEALQLAGDDADVRWSVELNRLRLVPETEKIGRMTALATALDQAAGQDVLARHHLNLGYQATESGAQTLHLAYHHLDTARRLAGQHKDSRLETEALDALAQLYENQGRIADGLALTVQALRTAETLSPAQKADLVISLEWRRGRLLNARGDLDAALAAYRRAVEQIDVVRQDIPVEYEDGRSSYRTLFEPVYTTYADLMLRQVDTRSSEAGQLLLQQVVQTLELIRQTELQDFLGDRCSTEAVQGGARRLLPAGTAVLYPLILTDRLELLLVGNEGIARFPVAVRGAALRDEAFAYAASLRRGLPDTRGAARRLNDWLLAPLAETLTKQGVERLVVVPDGAVRLIPLAALYDGQRYAVEKYAISMVTGMSMTNVSDPVRDGVAALVAGLAQPGPVVGKLGTLLAAQVLDPDAATGANRPGLVSRGGMRELRMLEVRARQQGKKEEGHDGHDRRNDPVAVKPSVSLAEVQALRERLALPGVGDEVRGLGGILAGQRLLDGEFTVNRFQDAVASGDYRILHIASHGIFGGNAESSFIMAYDDVLDMNALQRLLKAEKFQKAPIELLSLSACQTAEGNDRAPLGISGAAIKARAKSVLGTLWPVEDAAAKTLMQHLYKGLAQEHRGKADALRQAQLNLLHDPATQHPFYWAPFVLIGNWL